MTAAMECPISTCDWTLEVDYELEARNVALSPSVAAALGVPLDAFLSIRNNQLAQRVEGEIEEHLVTHSAREWLTDLSADRTRIRRALEVADQLVTLGVSSGKARLLEVLS